MTILDRNIIIMNSTTWMRSLGELVLLVDKIQAGIKLLLPKDKPYLEVKLIMFRIIIKSRKEQIHNLGLRNQLVSR